MSSVSSNEENEHKEDVLEPELMICDAHHHLMNHPAYMYSLNDFQRDLATGHHVTSTVFVEASCHYRNSGPEHFRPVGETEFARGVQEQTQNAGTQVAQAIVAFADLTLADRVAAVLDAHLEASAGTLKGIRQNATRDACPELHSGYDLPGPELYERSDFRAGAAELARRNLTLDTWQYFHQLPALISLAGACPDLRMVVDHVGGIVGVGPYASGRDEIMNAWRGYMTELAGLPNVWVKLGGLGMHGNGLISQDRTAPPSSAELAAAWSPYLEFCIEAFGADRCMFESNFPIDLQSCSYRTLWNAFKRVADGASVDEKTLLFHDTAARFYGIEA